MVNAVHNLTPGEPANSAAPRLPVQTSVINYGRDTKLTFHDGSVLVLRGVSRVEAVFPPDGDPLSKLSAVRRKISGDG